MVTFFSILIILNLIVNALGSLGVVGDIIFFAVIALVIISIIKSIVNSVKNPKSKRREMSPRERNKFRFAHGLISYDEYMREEARLDFYGYD